MNIVKNNKRRIGKLTLIFSILGFLYALLPLLGAIFYSGGFGSDPGPYWLLLIPPFWPLFVTFNFFVTVISLALYSLQISLSEKVLFTFGGFFNLLVWTILGYLIGLLISKIRGRK